MKIAILGDIHFKKCKEIEKKYRERVFYFVFKTLQERNISDLIQLGDLFDDRKHIDLQVYDETVKLYDKYFSELNSVTVLLGNHDLYFKDVHDVNSPVLLQEKFSNLRIIYKIQETDIGLFVPWLNASNIDEFKKMVETSKAKHCFGHFEINSFAMIKGFEENNGLSASVFNKFDKVFSGHFHLTQDKSNISYVGSLFQNDRNDVNDIKRFMILDTKTGEIEEVRIPFELFNKVTITSEEEMTDDLIDSFSEKINDIIFTTERSLKREKYIDKIMESAKDFEYQIIDNSELCKEKIDLKSENDDVKELFVDYLALSETYDVKRKESLKEMFVDIYNNLKEK